MSTIMTTEALTTTPSFTSSNSSIFSSTLISSTTKPASPTTSKSTAAIKARNKTMLPYREENSTKISYQVSSPPLLSPSPTNKPITTPAYCEYVTNLEAHYDSDAEPLIRPASPSSTYSTAFEEHQAGEVKRLTEEEVQNFTATGRPMPAFKQSALANLGGCMITLPQLLPKRYTDDSIIPAIVTGVIPSLVTTAVSNSKRRSSILGMLKGNKKEEKVAEKGMVKVVYMPRRDYVKWFKRDEKNEYCGTEPFRRWREEELEEMFGKYKPVPVGRSAGKKSF